MDLIGPRQFEGHDDDARWESWWWELEDVDIEMLAFVQGELALCVVGLRIDLKRNVVLDVDLDLLVPS